jgi:hypothetical protein
MWELHVARLQAIVDDQTKALDAIRLHGTDMPPAAGYNDAEWWRSVAWDCMRIARDAAEATGGDDGVCPQRRAGG